MGDSLFIEQGAQRGIEKRKQSQITWLIISWILQSLGLLHAVLYLVVCVLFAVGIFWEVVCHCHPSMIGKTLENTAYYTGETQHQEAAKKR